MSNDLKPGMTFTFSYQIPENKTVPHLYLIIDVAKFNAQVKAKEQAHGG